MNEAVRMGGESMYTTAQDALDKSAQDLHPLADREYWKDTPLSRAFGKDKAAADAELTRLGGLTGVWQKPLNGLNTPAGFTDAGFHWVPGGSGGGENFFDQTGITKWISERYWTDEGGFYADPSVKADAATVKKFTDLGNSLYGEGSAASSAEQQAWANYTTFNAPVWDDDARIFFASGGFPRTAPKEGTAEFRIAVEDLKRRFASCNWHNPVDPNRVLGKEVAAATAEWQQEIASQATQRNQVFDANKKATAALQAGAKALGDLLGESWVADRATRWEDYWSAGGPGWIGDKPLTVAFHAAGGKCLDVEGGKTGNGTPVQIYTCNGSGAQQWTVYGDDSGLHLENTKSQRCLDIQHDNAVDGTKIQIWDCNSSPAQTWDFRTNTTTALKNAGTSMCLDLHKYTNGYNAWLWGCNGSGPQQFDIKPSGHDGDVPPSSQFHQAAQAVSDAKAQAKTQLGILKMQATTAADAAAASDTAEKTAYGIADRNGAPRGRGLLVGEQKAQVTQGAAAALQAMVKAGETAEAATRASAGDSRTIAQRALAQAAQVKAEFRKKAAEKAEAQAKAAADAAKTHRDNAKADAAAAKSKLGDAVKAEADAKSAAATAHAKRLHAEAEEATAKAQKETAKQKEAEAAQHKSAADGYATKAKTADAAAKKSEATAQSKRTEAETASKKAKDLRDDAWNAEQKADADRAKADAKDAYASSLDAGDAADAARAAANSADKQATASEAAAKSARSEADAATKAAADADAAATKAEAAAKRARSDADAADAAKLKADADVKTATSAAADAIQASQDAAGEAKQAVKDADEAESQAKSAKTDADTAKTEAGKARTASAKAAGYAYITAQAAVDASTAAQQVAKPANDAIQIGSPYIQTDSAAGLVVLTGQASKTIAQQQQAVAEAHATSAADAASAAQRLADQADADTKATYQHAANAAGYAADARAYAKQALDYAADAATSAAAATASVARTVTYDKQAADEAKAADTAATGAEGYAKQARDAADQAELDAQAARDAASAAEQAAKDARAAADRADQAAADAEQYAKDAQKYAEDAQAAAESAERQQANKQVSTGAGTGVGGVFFVVDKIEPIGDPQPENDCVIEPGFSGCTVKFTLHFNATVSFYLCVNPNVPATAAGCPKTDTVYLDTKPFKNLKREITRYFSKLEIIEGISKVIAKVAWGILTHDIVDCWHGSASGCAWAAATFIPGKKIEDAVKAARAFQEALSTGVSVEEAMDRLKVADAATMAALEAGMAEHLAAVEGVKVARSTLEARLVEYMRRFSLGVDPAKGMKFNSGEMQSAIRVETERGVTLERDPSGDLEWYDQKGRGYDAVGNSPSKYLKVPQLMNAIKGHLLKTEKSGRFVSFVPVDVFTYTAEQISEIKTAVKGLPQADQARIFYVGDHT
ncbi:RICIN domain-containing protein [Streptomyces beihaiensis]|uniref:RICIN domain-containing protein n=1 Tax=Streptomyces beihaiensis TaxID=2984495 RepID=A0ABT3U1B4_9ACTN|nr:RICIN domain-containing protein [Streptomyces beihaiensis]MCX3063059.1 RICIN domain-containing protein [Streptomyces beihaiensis]